MFFGVCLFFVVFLCVGCCLLLFVVQRIVLVVCRALCVVVFKCSLCVVCCLLHDCWLLCVFVAFWLVAGCVLFVE